MLGYKPNIKSISNPELNSKQHISFIELGVKKPKCKKDCECKKCMNK